jgi:hypothetical protein
MGRQGSFKTQPQRAILGYFLFSDAAIQRGASWLGRTAHACPNGRPNERRTTGRPERRSRLRGHDDRRSRRHGARAWADSARPAPGDGAPRSGGSTPPTRPARASAGVLIRAVGRPGAATFCRRIAILGVICITALVLPASRTAPFVPATHFASGLSPSFAPAPERGVDGAPRRRGCLRGTLACCGTPRRLRGASRPLAIGDARLSALQPWRFRASGSAFPAPSFSYGARAAMLLAAGS